MPPLELGIINAMTSDRQLCEHTPARIETRVLRCAITAWRSRSPVLAQTDKVRNIPH
jgi:hypothetical protein